MNIAMDLIREALLGGSGGGGGGGGDALTLLKTESLGAISVTSTSSVNLNKTVTMEGILGLYDALVYEVRAAEKKQGYHYSTKGIIWGTLSGGVADYQNVPHKLNASVDNSGNTNLKSSSTVYGVFSDGAPVKSGQDVTLSLWGKYNSTHTLTIDGDYTIYVYGLNLPS